MADALIVWGGWDGHEPEKGAHIVAKMLTDHGTVSYTHLTLPTIYSV